MERAINSSVQSSQINDKKYGNVIDLNTELNLFDNTEKPSKRKRSQRSKLILMPEKGKIGDWSNDQPFSSGLGMFNLEN